MELAFPATVYKFPFSPHPHQHYLFLVFLRTAILTGVKCCLIVAFLNSELSIQLNKLEKEQELF